GRDAPVAACELADGADVRAAAAAEDQRAVRQLARERRVLLLERVLVDECRLRPRDLHQRRLLHLAAATTPGARDAHEPGAELAPAGVALVVTVERDGGVRAAVGTARAEPAHRSTFSNASISRVTAIPTCR